MIATISKLSRSKRSTKTYILKTLKRSSQNPPLLTTIFNSIREPIGEVVLFLSAKRTQQKFGWRYTASPLLTPE